MNPTLKKSLPTFIFCLLLGFGYAQQRVEMSLQRAIDYAMDNNNDIQIARLNIKDAEQQIYETRATGLPQITGEVSFNRFLKIPTSVLPSAFEELIKIGNGGDLPPDFSNQISFALKNSFQVGINLKTMLFDGSFFTGLKAARLFRTLVQKQLAAKEMKVKNQVIETYLPALIINENLTILDKNIGNLEKLLYETKALYKEGFVEQLDVDRLTLSLANLGVEKENLARQKEVSINYLKLTMNYPKNVELVITDDIAQLLSPVSADDIEGAVNYYNRLDYKAIETSLQLNDLNIDYTRNIYLPSLNLNASYNQAYQGDKIFNDPNSFWAPTAIVGLSLNVPIFDGFGKKAKIQRAKLAYEIARTQQTQLSDLIYVEISNARIQYKSASKRLESQKKNLALAEKIHVTTQIKYKEGVGSSLEITQSEQSLFDSQRNYTQAMFDLLQAKVALDKALGK